MSSSATQPTLRVREFSVNAERHFVCSKNDGGMVLEDGTPFLAGGLKLVWGITLLNSDSSPHLFEQDDEFELSIIQEYSDTAYLVHAANDDFNVAGDWEDMNAINGKLSVRIDTTTNTFLDAVKDGDLQQVRVEISVNAPGLPAHKIIRFTCPALARVLTGRTDPS